MLQKAEEDALLRGVCPADPVTSLVLRTHPPKCSHQYTDISSLHFKNLYWKIEKKSAWEAQL